MNTYFEPQRSRPRIRDHSAFWLAFLGVLLVGLFSIATVFATVGLPAAAGLLCAELSLALYAAIR